MQLIKHIKKLALVLVISFLITGISNKASLKHVFYIRYLAYFQKRKNNVQVLINFKSKINRITLANTLKLSFWIWKTNISIQKIDTLALTTFEIIMVGFQLQVKLKKARFFQKAFLMAEISKKMVFKISFLTFNNIDIGFINKKLLWKIYSTANVK